MAKKFERSEETQALVAYLRMLDKNERVSYTKLTEVAGIKVVANTPKLIYARFILERDHNAVWICVKPKIGIRRLNDIEIAERLPKFWLNGARSKLNRGGHQADVVETRELDIDQQARFAVDSIQRELAFDALSKATRKKMERVARGTSNDLPSFTAIEWAISLSPKAKAKI
jgi:hypothetical protein